MNLNSKWLTHTETGQRGSKVDCFQRFLAFVVNISKISLAVGHAALRLTTFEVHRRNIAPLSNNGTRH